MRELDLRIAKEVLKLNVVENKSGRKSGGVFHTIGPANWYDLSGDMQLANPVPPYSRDLNEIMDVVQEVLQNNKHVKFSLHYSNRKWVCSFHGEDGLLCSALASEPAETVCTALVGSGLKL